MGLRPALGELGPGRSSHACAAALQLSGLQPRLPFLGTALVSPTATALSEALGQVDGRGQPCLAVGRVRDAPDTQLGAHAKLAPGGPVIPVLSLRLGRWVPERCPQATTGRLGGLVFAGGPWGVWVAGPDFPGVLGRAGQQRPASQSPSCPSQVPSGCQREENLIFTRLMVLEQYF